MTLSLVAPTGAVTTVPSGIIVVRCQDYVAAGATTTTDAASVSGTVVLEDQTLAVQTTFASQGTLYGSAADTISVPRGDLPIDTSALSYHVFIAMRVTGEVPSNAKGGTSWEAILRTGASAGFGWGTNTTYQDGPVAIARSRFEEYLIYDCGELSSFSFTTLRARGWGITGGNVEMRFDLIYLVPFLFGPDFNATQENSGSGGLPLRFATNGVLTKDLDDDTSTWIGSHTVNAFNFPWMRDGASDVQENDDEPTAVVDGFGDWTDEASPRSHLAFIAGATKPPDSETILDDTFGNSDSAGTIDQTDSWTINGYWAQFISNSIDNSYVDGSGTYLGWVFRSGIPRCYIGGGESSTVPITSGEASMAWGFSTGSVSADPRDYLERLQLREGVFEGAFRFDVLQEAYGFVGMDAPVPSSTIRVGGAIELDSSGNVKVSVRFLFRPTEAEEIMDEATVITGATTSSVIRVKSERRGVTWRAKAWLDGGSEPGWQVEGVEPVVAQSTGGVYSLVSHPWDTNWAASVAHDNVIYDPRRQIGTVPTFSPVAVAAVGAGNADTIIYLEQFTVSFDPGSGTPGDIDVKVVKYDSTTVLDPAITVPYGSHRFVAGTSKQRRFNSDTDAYGIWAWKSEAGEPDTEFASVGYIWELRDYTPVSAFRPQIYRRVVTG